MLTYCEGGDARRAAGTATLFTKYATSTGQQLSAVETTGYRSGPFMKDWSRSHEIAMRLSQPNCVAALHIPNPATSLLSASTLDDSKLTFYITSLLFNLSPVRIW